MCVCVVSVFYEIDIDEESIGYLSFIAATKVAPSIIVLIILYVSSGVSYILNIISNSLIIYIVYK